MLAGPPPPCKKFKAPFHNECSHNQLNTTMQLGELSSPSFRDFIFNFLLFCLNSKYNQLNYYLSTSFYCFITRAESSLRSGVFQYYNISRTIWMIKSLKIVTYVLWLLTCCYMSWYCTMLCNFGTSIWYS